MKTSILNDTRKDNLNIHIDIEDGRVEIFGDNYIIELDFEYEIENLHFEGDGVNTPEEVFFDVELNCFSYEFFNNEGDDVKMNFTKTELGEVEYRVLQELEEVIKDEELYE